MTSVPPGVERSFARGVVHDDLPPDPSSEFTVWARKNLTVQNLLIVLVLLFQAGGWWQRERDSTADVAKTVRALEVRLLAAEATQDGVATIYVRRDVLAETLKSMDERLKNIETWMRNNGK